MFFFLQLCAFFCSSHWAIRFSDLLSISVGCHAFILACSVGKDYSRLLKYADSLYRCKQLKKAAMGRWEDTCTWSDWIRKLGSALPWEESEYKSVSLRWTGGWIILLSKISGSWLGAIKRRKLSLNYTSNGLRVIPRGEQLGISLRVIPRGEQLGISLRVIPRGEQLELSREVNSLVLVWKLSREVNSLSYPERWTAWY